MKIPLDDIARSILNANTQKATQGEVRDLSYPQQDKFVIDSASRVAACTTRRAGKSTGLALRFVRTLRKHRGATCRYIALTRDSARDIMWPVLEEINERYRLGAELKSSRLEMILPDGGGMIKL